MKRQKTRKAFVSISLVSVFALLALTALGRQPSITQTDSRTCPGRIVVHYYTPPRSSWQFPLCDTDANFNCTNEDFVGYLYLPEGRDIANSQRRLPLIVFNHGSGDPDGDAVSCTMPQYFTDQGYAFFIPFRRGHGPSTGWYYPDYVNAVCPEFICTNALSHYFLLNYLKDQSFEVGKAMDYMRSLRNSAGQRVIDPDKIGLMGHSFGGIVTLFANGELTDHKAAIAIAPASESWSTFDREDGDNTPDSSASIDQLKDAVRHANRPLYFLEPLNDDSTRPVVVLSKIAGNHTPTEQYQAALFPRVENLGDSKAHVLFVLRQDEVELWGPSAVDFMTRYGVR